MKREADAVLFARPRRASIGARAIGTLQATYLATLCSCAFTTSTGPSAPILATVTVSLKATTITVGQSVAASAAGLDQAGASINVGLVSWNTGSTAIATVTSDGAVTGVAPGQTQILASVGGKLGQATITVTTALTPLRFTTLTTGWGFTCGLADAGAAYCWGRSDFGQLGDGGPTTRSTPTSVQGGRPFTALTSGDFHSCALTATGAAYCWGHNLYGELGEGALGDEFAPMPVLGGLTFTAITAGHLHSCALTSTGATYCWGANSAGELGDGTTTRRLTPNLIFGGTTFASVAAGWSLTCGLTTAGAALCWGLTVFGFPVTAPLLVPGGLTFTALTVGEATACGLTSAGAAYCWDVFAAATPVPGGIALRALSLWGNVAQGLYFEVPGHACGLTSAGEAYCWGNNGAGELGDGTQVYRVTPTRVLGGLRFTGITAGPFHTCAWTGAGAAYCWGSNDSGELGDGTATFRTAPALVSGGSISARRTLTP